MKKCVFSGSTEHLNTSMTIKLDGGDAVTVWISDEYAEEATPSKVKSAYLKTCVIDEEKQKEIDALLARAKELGIDLTPRSVINDPPKASGNDQEHIKLTPRKGNIIVNSEEADRKTLLNPSVNAQGSASSYASRGADYAIQSVDNPTENLRDGEQSEIGVVEGRGGVPIRIPIRRHGKMGTTSIRVEQKVRGADMERRFKNLADNSMGKSATMTNIPDFRNSYEVRFVQCPLCRGQGQIKNKICPKCDGAGEVESI